MFMTLEPPWNRKNYGYGCACAVARTFTHVQGRILQSPPGQVVAFDHVVGNVWDLLPAVNRLAAATGFHEFAEFVASDIGTVDSGLNSVSCLCHALDVLLFARIWCS